MDVFYLMSEKLLLRNPKLMVQLQLASRLRCRRRADIQFGKGTGLKTQETLCLISEGLEIKGFAFARKGLWSQQIGMRGGLGKERFIDLASLEVVRQSLEEFVAEFTNLYNVRKTAFRLLFHNNDSGSRD